MLTCGKNISTFRILLSKPTYICTLQPGTLDWQYNTRSQQGNNCHIYLQRPVYMRNTWLWHIEKNSKPNKHATWLSKGLVNEPISWHVCNFTKHRICLLKFKWNICVKLTNYYACIKTSFSYTVIWSAAFYSSAFIQTALWVHVTMYRILIKVFIHNTLFIGVYFRQNWSTECGPKWRYMAEIWMNFGSGNILFLNGANHYLKQCWLIIKVFYDENLIAVPQEYLMDLIISKCSEFAKKNLSH